MEFRERVLGIQCSVYIWYLKSLRRDIIKKEYRQRKRRQPKTEPWRTSIIKDQEE